jgi:heme exporter protein A
MLDARALSLSRGHTLLFRDVQFSLKAGEALILRGPNGVGKTSLLRVLAGLTTPDTGEVAINGVVACPLSEAWRARIAYIGHANSIKDELSAQENLNQQLALDGLDVSFAARLQALDAVGLIAKRQVIARQLSQGQKRRIGLARLTLCAAGRRIWLLDEPTNALDTEGVSLFNRIVDAFLKDGGAAVIASHLPLDITPQRDWQMQVVA